ncbi:response regulator [Rhodoblastus sp.]|mgnify:CR=1 FL=1|jgi:CheY-like chemotaxis protein|uniref:response regulator n=1 Tax=Rhodoblastus sp. TaxID=1962975 RepID=UPI0025F3264C|nr:response regulator [Rhodoblastus sp.]
MSLSSLIGPQIPLLRRYARALSGSQASGDSYVAAVLETLLADPSLFDRSAEPRGEIYRLFSLVWNAMPLNGRSSEGKSPGSQTDSRLELLTPLPRQAFLLTAVEGFDPDKAARILDVTRPDFDAMIEQAGREIGAQVATSVMIIEDEPLIAMDLETLVESLGHTVVGMARTRAEAVALARATRPGLVLADIRLADGSSGLDAVNEILESFGVPVIFITAYPESLLTGQRPEPAFLISKPFRSETVKAIVSQAMFFNELARPPQRRTA